MQIRFPFIMFSLLVGLLSLSELAQAEQNLKIYLAADSSLENTKQNIRDKNDATLTPLDQTDTKTDIKITAHIRRAVIEDKALSVDAHNAKIITINGVVTLRGPVETQAESVKLQQISQETPDVAKVDNQLEIKAP